MKKIYITGIAGLLGSNLLYCLRDKYEVGGCDLIQVRCQVKSFDSFDLLDYEELEKRISKCQPDIIIHTAAMVNVDACEENEKLAYKMNDDLTRKIGNIAKNIGSKVIYISTDAVFDGEQENLYTEEDKPNPINIYGMTKLAGENHILEEEVNVVLRTNIYGFNIQKKDSFGEWIIHSLNEGKELNMFEDIDYSPILVNELAVLIDKIIEMDITGLYHACATGTISKYDFGCKVKDEFQLKDGIIHKTSSDHMTFRAKRSKHMGMSNEKLCKALGITMKTPQESIYYFKKLYSENYPALLKEQVKL